MGNQGIASLIWAAKLGALAHLRRLVLTGNRLSDLGGIASAFSHGALPSVKELVLSSNRIRASGVTQLAHATLSDGSSAIGHVERLYLDHNEIGHEQEDAASCNSPSAGGGGGMMTVVPTTPGSPCDHPGGGSMRHSAPSAGAVVALANACTGALTLDLGTNGLEDAHMDALADAIAAGRAFSHAFARARGDPYPVGAPPSPAAKDWTCVRLDVSLNKYTQRARQRLEAACHEHGGIRCSV